MKIIVKCVAILGLVALMCGCATQTVVEKTRKSKVISQEPVVAPDSDFEGKK